MSRLEEWEQWRKLYGYEMPAAPRWKRLPVIRHIRAKWHQFWVAQHNQAYISLGMIPTGYDSWVLVGIWLGKEKDPT